MPNEEEEAEEALIKMIRFEVEATTPKTPWASGSSNNNNDNGK